MKPLALAALSLLLLSGTAAASNSVPRVDAVAEALPADGIAVACRQPQIRAADVEAVLGTHDAVRTATLRTGLTHAVQEACGQGVASIVVTRRGLAVAWAPALDRGSAVALVLR